MSSPKNILLLLLYIPLGIIIGSVLFSFVTAQGGGGHPGGLLWVVTVLPSLVAFILTAIIHTVIKKFLPIDHERLYFFLIWLVIIFLVMNDIGIEFIYSTLPALFGIL